MDTSPSFHLHERILEQEENYISKVLSQREKEKSLSSRGEITTTNSIQVSVGFWFEQETGYLIKFSENKKEWQCLEEKKFLIVPPINHPKFEYVFRHEVRHAKDFDWISQYRSFFILRDGETKGNFFKREEIPEFWDLIVKYGSQGKELQNFGSPRDFGSIPPNIERILQGVQRGDRNNSCFKLAAYLKDFELPQELTSWVLNLWNHVFNPEPLDGKEIDSTVRSAYKRQIIPKKSKIGAVKITWEKKKKK